MKNRSALHLLFGAVFVLGLAGCAGEPRQPQAEGPSAAAAARAPAPVRRKAPAPRPDEPADPLLDAPYQTSAECRADGPLAAGDRFGDTRLICDSLKVSATVTEFRDAGWRIEELRMTETKTEEGEITIPFTVTLRKLF